MEKVLVKKLNSEKHPFEMTKSGAEQLLKKHPGTYKIVKQVEPIQEVKKKEVVSDVVDEPKNEPKSKKEPKISKTSKK